MLSSLLIIVLSALPRLPVGPAAQAVPAATSPVALAQAAPASPGPPSGTAPAPAPASQPTARALAAKTDRAAARVAATRRVRDQARAEKARLARTYEAQLDELDRLKRQRASWRRDRLIRTRMSESHATAEALEDLDQRIRRLGAILRRHEAALVAAIRREHAAGPGASRRRQLDRWYAQARRHLRPSAKKIVLPDDRLDPLADPEELDYQAALIRESEQELAAELARLQERAERYRHMSALRRKRSRAAALGGFDGEQPRRTTGRAGTASLAGGRNGEEGVATPGGASGPAPAPPSDGSGTPEADPSPTQPDSGSPGDVYAPGDSAMFDIVLADVVDAPTLEALRAADRSSDPALKARAAERAHQQVKARLERLRAQRRRIQRRARELHRP